eukprot:18247-Heterococcus_DN1.PRE.1
MQLPTATTTRKCTLLRQRQQQSAVTAASSSNNRRLQAAVLPSIELSEVNCMRTCSIGMLHVLLSRRDAAYCLKAHFNRSKQSACSTSREYA